MPPKHIGPTKDCAGCETTHKHKEYRVGNGVSRFCPLCRNKKAVERYHQKKEQGLCISCSTEASDGRQYCPRCRLRHRLWYLSKRYDLSKRSFDNMLDRQQGCCVYCRVELDLWSAQVDHKVPRSKGGKHVRRNFQLLCRRCNVAKADMLEDAFLSWARGVVDENKGE